MDHRLELARAFVAQAGWEGARILPISGDASFRRYFRVLDDRRTAILMDAPPEREDVGPFLRVGDVLRGFGYSAPAALAEDAAAGFLLLEDLGDDLFARVLAKNDAAEAELYGAAVDLLRDLRGHGQPEGVPDFDTSRALREVRLFMEWTYPALASSSPGSEVSQSFDEVWRAALTPLFGVPKVLALFDFHAENLVWLPARTGLARVGLLDYQDAVAGPAALDLVSLLEDARRDVPPELVESMINRFTDGYSQVEREAFDAVYALAGAQRNTRIIGVFGRLWLRDRKPGYLALLPRVWRHLATDLSHPHLRDVRGWFDHHVPAEWRDLSPSPASFVLPEGV